MYDIGTGTCEEQIRLSDCDLSTEIDTNFAAEDGEPGRCVLGSNALHRDNGDTHDFFAASSSMKPLTRSSTSASVISFNPSNSFDAKYLKSPPYPSPKQNGM